MIQIGILSMQRIQNYGSFLQAYGLKGILEELGCEVQFVDYHPGVCLVASAEGTGLRRKLMKALETLRYQAPLAEKLRFMWYKKNYAKKYFPLLGGVTETRNYNPQVDVLVIGSDEVFNCVQSNTNVGFCPELFGVGAKTKKIISYAASFGNTTLDKLQEYQVSEQVGTWLKQFAAISVRDRNSGEIVRALTGVDPDFHLDPALIYDFHKEREMVSKGTSEQKYMLVYGYSGRFSQEECYWIKDYADRKELKVYCIGGVQNCCDRFLDCDPFQVISYFQNADCVVTDTFHGTILSVITHRPFAAIVRENGYGNAEKLTDLLGRLGLEKQQLAQISQLETLLSEKIDFETVDALLNKERLRTRQYLKEQISL